MTVQTALREAQSILFYAEVDTPFLDATVLLAEALGLSKEKLFASLPEPLEEERYRDYRRLLEQRCAGLPVSYIRGRKEFYSLEFLVDRRVLVPRPDTETLVEQALRLAATRRIRDVHDAFTGSGCVAIALKHHCPAVEVSASDLSPEAGEVFEANSRRLLGYPLPFSLSDCLEGVAGPFDLITANPPYLTEAEVEAMRKVGWPEPEAALHGGADGLRLIRRLVRQAPTRLRRPGSLLLEASPSQMPAVAALLEAEGFSDIELSHDLAGRERVARACLWPT